MKSKNIRVLFVIFITITSLLPLQSVVALDVVQDQEIINEEKIYSRANANGDFAENRVLVVFNKNESNMLKEHTIDDFSEVDVKKVRDLTENTKTMIKNKRRETVTNNLQRGITSISEVINDSQFNQILSIELNTPGKTNVLEAIKKLETRNDILYVGPDYTISAASVEPNDSLYTHVEYTATGEEKGQWGHRKIQLPEAWEITTGSSDVVVGVLDTGIDGTHPDLQGQIDTGLCRDFTSGDTEVVTTPTDPGNHGTASAGIIGARGNNITGMSGVCWNVKLVSLRILDATKNGYSSNFISAVDFATSQNIPILNFSGRWIEIDSKYNIPVDAAIANYPGLFICASGNDAQNIDEFVVYPADYDLSNIIVVANTTSKDELYYKDEDVGSNYGPETVHLAAPGSYVLGTYPTSSCTLGTHKTETHIDVGYHYMGGTSFAAPYVTGVAALIKSIRPDLSAKEIKALILDNVDPLPDFEELCISGGRLNAYESVRAATESQTFTGDVNGDDRADVILSRNVGGMRALTVYMGQYNGYFSEPITTQSARTFNYCDSAYAGDFDGDGLTDVVVHWNNNGYRQLLVYRSRGDGSFYEGVNLSSNQLYISNTLSYSMHIADVNGDSKDDFIVYYQDADDIQHALVYKGNSSSPYLIDATTDAFVSTEGYGVNKPIYIGDFNGDGRADILFQWSSSNKRRLKVCIGTVSGTFSPGGTLMSTRTYDESQYPTKKYVADVDGNGTDDFVVCWKNSSSNISVSVYKGSMSSPYLYEATTDALTSTNPYIESDTILMGDINNDGTSDMVVDSVGSSGNRKLYIYTAYIDGTFNLANTYNTSDFHDSNACSNGLFLDDVNGDGRDDLIVKRNNGGYNRLKTYLGTSAGLFEAAIDTAPSNSIPFCNSDTADHSGSGTYKIINVGAEKCLNVYGDNVTVLYNQQNVCLWEDSGTNEQRWYVTEIGNSQFIKSVIDTNFGLNVYRSGSSWNCDLYPTSGNETDSLIDFIETDGGFKIKLHNYDLYLTAASSANGANVYWSAASTSTYQLWSLVSA